MTTKWLLTGIKRTRRHEIRLLADTAEEAVALAKNSYRFTKIVQCIEEVPVRSGNYISLGWLAANDPIYKNAGWNFIFGKNLNPRLAPKRTEERSPSDEAPLVPTVPIS
jgi:hypothetical protein